MCERPGICLTFAADEAMREASYEVARKEKAFRAAHAAHVESYGTSQATIMYKRKMNALWTYMTARQEFNRRVQAYIEVIEVYAKDLEEKR